MKNTALSNVQSIHFLKVGQYKIYYNNKIAALQTVKEIFDELPYQFETDKPDPFIIDAGSNIGIATIFFKSIYPQARILCFEPDPKSFNLMKMNVEANKLTNVTLVNAALSNKEGLIDFYGQIHADNSSAMGNSIIEAWGMQREISDQIKVKSVKLSSFINTQVDLLKLDIEGAEQQVLEELNNKLNLVKTIAFEVHEAEKIKFINDINKILFILDEYNFDVAVKQKDVHLALPDQVKHWAEKLNPHLYTVMATKK